jgi:hypothetical protein
MSFRIDTVAPTLRALSFRKLSFRVSEPATIRLIVNGKLVTRTVRAGVFSFARLACAVFASSPRRSGQPQPDVAVPVIQAS